MKNIATLLASMVLVGLARFAQADAPTVTAPAVAAVNGGATQFSATINPGVKPTKVVFNYGVSTAALSQTATIYLPAAPVSQTATVSVTGLVGGQTYHFNAVASNADATAGVTADGTDFAVAGYVPTLGRVVPVVDVAGTATLKATVIPNGTAVTAVKFDYGTTTAYGTTVDGTPATVDGAATTTTETSAGITGLVAGQQYHYRVRATNGTGEAVSGDYLFNTAVNKPSVGEVTNGAAQLEAFVATGEAAKNVTFNYGIAGGPLNNKMTLVISAKTDPQQVALSIASLVGGQTYRFNLVVGNVTEPVGEVTADGFDFVVPAYAPTVLRNAHTVKTDGTATLKATVTPNGAPVSEIKFEYGTTIAYGITVPGNPATINDATVTTGVESKANLTGLVRGQLYHYRISATNNLGTISTQDATFATAANKAPIARADKVFLQGDKPVVINVLANDSDPDPGDTISLVSVTQGKQGRTEIVGNMVKYTPLPDATGGDTFSYVIRDSFTTSPKTATGKVTITAPALSARGLKAAPITNADGDVLGMIKLNGTPTGQITGKVTINNDTYAVSGSLDANGRFNYTIPRQNGQSLQLTVDFSDPTKSFQANLAQGSELYKAEAPAYAITDKRRDEIVGKYTVQLPPGSATADDGSPSGNGYAQMEVHPWGAVSIKGKLGDGTKFSTSGVLGGTDTAANVTMWVTPDDSRVSAQFTFGTEASPTVTGEMKWYRSPNDQSDLYPEGFFTTVSPTGSRYAPPDDGHRALDTSNSKANITISEGNLGTDITHNIEISKSDRVTVLNPSGDGFSFKIDRENGTFKGFFNHPIDGDQRKFEGVLVQSQGKGSGVFTGVDQAGSVMLTLGLAATPTPPTTGTGNGGTGNGGTGNGGTGNNGGNNNGGIDTGGIDTGGIDIGDIDTSGLLNGARTQRKQ